MPPVRAAKNLQARPANASREVAARAALEAMLAGVTDAGIMRRLLGELLTPAELHDLGLRLRLLTLLQSGWSQREIAERLGVSLCKITRGSRVLKQPDSVIAALLRRAPSAKRE